MSGGRPRRRLVILSVVVAGFSSLLTGCTGIESAAPGCTGDSRRLALVAQSVPGAAYLPCVGPLPAGWSTAAVHISSGRTHFRLESDRSRPVDVELLDRCDVSGATPTTPRADGVRTYRRLDSITPRYRGTLFDVFAGGCLTYRFDFQRGAHITLTEEFQTAAGLRSRRDLALELRRDLGVDLDR